VFDPKYIRKVKSRSERIRLYEPDESGLMDDEENANGIVHGYLNHYTEGDEDNGTFS